MKVCVLSEGDDLDSMISEDFGHAPFFLIIDTDTMDYQAIKNEHARALQGAGMKVAATILEFKVDAVMTGGIGPHGYNKLVGAGITVSFDEEGTVKEGVLNLKRRMG